MASVSFQYLPEDFLDAWRLQMRHNSFVRACRFAPLILLFIGGLGVWTEFRDHGLMVGLFSILPTVILSGLLFGLNVLSDRVLLPGRAKRFLSQQKSLQGEVSIGWDAEGVAFVAQAGQSRMAWGDYFKWLENDSVLVLFQSELLLNVLPKRCLSEGEVVEIRDRLTATLGKAGKARKIALPPASAAGVETSPSRPAGPSSIP
jgi:hypothetical protein